MFPIGTDCPQRRIPWTNLALIVANVVIYFLTHGRVDSALRMQAFLLQPRTPVLLQFITYQFLHETPMHLIGNMIFLYVFGNNLNEKLGHVGYLAFYLSGGVAAGIGQFLTSSAPTLGASGAISAVAGMYLVLLPRTNIRVLFVIFLYTEFEIPSMYLILFNLLQDVFYQSIGGGQVAYVAHITGTVFGAVIGMLLLVTRLIPRDAYDLVALFTRWKRRREYQAIVAGGHDFFGPSAKLRNDGSTPPLPPVEVALRQDVLNLLAAQQFAEAAKQYLELLKLNPESLLPEQPQLDIANQLLAQGNATEAATAYELFLKSYKSAQRSQVELLLGLTYARDVFRPDRAIDLLRSALAALTDPHQRALAQQELARLDPHGPTS